MESTLRGIWQSKGGENWAALKFQETNFGSNGLDEACGLQYGNARELVDQVLNLSIRNKVFRVSVSFWSNNICWRWPALL